MKNRVRAEFAGPKVEEVFRNKLCNLNVAILGERHIGICGEGILAMYEVSLNIHC